MTRSAWPRTIALAFALACATCNGSVTPSPSFPPTPDARPTRDGGPQTPQPTLDTAPIERPSTAIDAAAPRPDAATTFSDTSSSDAAGADGGGDPGELLWPNETSAANSDPWLLQHHEEITGLRPRALVVHFANGHTAEAVRARFQLMADGIRDGSTYHGYKDPTAKPFVIHQLTKLVDLTDAEVPPGWTAPNSTKMPRLNGGIDFGKLYDPSFADAFGFADPKDPGRNLGLCDLVKRGFINELYIAFNKTGTDAAVPEIIEYKQRYDAMDRPIRGSFDPYAGNGNFVPADLPAAKACAISLRVDFIEMTGTLSGAMHVYSHNFERMGFSALPNYRKFFYPFFNFDWDVRFKTPFRDAYSLDNNGSRKNVIAFTGQNAASWVCLPGSSCAGQMGMMDPLDLGCGNTHYPPNARNSYDTNNPQPVLTRCEHYGLRDGPGGKDLQTVYTPATIAPFVKKYGADGNGGGWQIYLLQNLPGHRSGAKLPDGTPIKNFWPYLYY